MNTLEQAILGPIRSELIGHNATFYSFYGKTIAENITEVELDSCGKLIRITADRSFMLFPEQEQHLKRINVSFMFQTNMK